MFLGLAAALAACTSGESEKTSPAPAVAAATATVAPGPASAPPPPAAVILVRHGEKAGGEGGDPSLSHAGRVRAEELARMLEKSGVTAIYATHYQRTRQTAAPLAERLGLQVRSIRASDVEEMARQVRSNSGGTVLAIGHSDSVPTLIQLLGGGKVEPIGLETFDDMYLLTFDTAGRTSVLRLKYGAAAPGRSP
jgi:broad specificity phosphatase PhoE